MNNFPVKGSDERISGRALINTIQIENSNGYIIETIRYNPNDMQGLAASIAHLLTEARDIGFKQGQEHVRKALGL